MVDSLAEALNRVSANPQSADTPLALPPQQARDGLRNPMPRWQRHLSTFLPEIGASIVSAPFSLYALADMGSQWAFNTPLRGGEGAREISNSITQPVREMSNRLAGEPVQDNLLSGDPLQVASAWGRLALTAGASAPVALGRGLATAQAKIKAGSEVAGAVTGTLGRALEVLTPITITSKPSPAIAALNIGVASAIGAGVEAAIGPADQLQKAVAEAENTTQGALDVAAQGAQEVQRADPRVTQAGFTTGSTAGDIAAVGLIGAATLYGIKRDAVNKIIEGRMRSVAGYDPRDPMNATTVTNTPTALKQQFISGTESIPQAQRNFALSQGKNKQAAWQDADRVAEEISFRSGPAVDSRMGSLRRFGEAPDSVIKMPAMDDVINHYKSLEPGKQAMADQVLIARQELDARATLLRDNYRISVGPVGSAGADAVVLGMERAGTVPRHHLWDVGSADLHRIVQIGMRDAEVAKSTSQYLDITRKMRDYMGEQRYRTRGEVRKMAMENPNYVPTRMAPGRKYMQREDQIERGGLRTWEELGSPYQHLPSYLDEVVRGAEGEKIKRTFLLPMMRAADRGDKFASSVFGRRDVKAGPQAADQFVNYRDQHGVGRNVEVKDAVLRNALRGVSSPSTLQMVSGALSNWARLVESGSVGAWAAATMTNVFPVSSALYSMTFGTALRPKGIAAGWLDKAMQTATGGKMGVRGDWLTLVPDVALRTSQNLGAVMIDRMARTLHNSVVTDGLLARTMGPTAAVTAAKALSNRFKRTGIYDLQQRGLLGPASMGAVDRARQYSHAKTVLDSHGFDTRLGSFLGDILHAVSSAPSMSLIAMNKGVDRTLLNSAVRNFAGDPGRSGAFRGGKAATAAAGGVAATPWGNLYLQNLSRLGEAIHRDPGGAAMGIFTSVGVPAIAATIWNANAGPEYADYQHNIRSPDKQASSIYIGMPGLPPEMGIEIPVDPSLRTFKYASELLAGSQLGLIDGSYYTPSNSDLHYQFKAMAEHRKGDVVHSVVEQSLIPPVMPPVALALSAAGMQPRSYIDVRPLPKAREKGFTEGGGSNPQAEFLDNYMPAQTEEVLKSIGSQAFVNIYRSIVDFGERREAGASVLEAGKAQVQAGKLRQADSTKMLGSGPLFNTFLAISPSVEASGSTVRSKLEGLRKFSEAATSGTSMKQAMVGTEQRGFQTRIGQGPQAPADMEMAQIASQAQFIYKQLNELYTGSIKDDYSQRSGIQNDPTKSPEMKRAIMNEYSDRIIDKNRKMLQDVLRYEAILSAKFGREIKFDKLKFNE